MRNDTIGAGAATGRGRDLPLLLALYLCWGTAIPAMKVMVETVPPMLGASLVFLVGGAVLGVAARRRPRPAPRQIRLLAAAGILLLVGGQGLAMIALTEVTASVGAILAAAIPLWVVVLGAGVGVRVTAGSLARLLFGFAGIAVVVLTAPGSAIGGAPWAVAAFCVAPILWAAGSLMTARVEGPVDLTAATAIQLLAGGATLLLVALVIGELRDLRLSEIGATSAAAALYLLIFDSLIGFMLYTRLLKRLPPPLVNTYAYVTPIVGAAVGATLLNEPLWTGAFVGGAMVIGAVALELGGDRGPRAL